MVGLAPALAGPAQASFVVDRTNRPQVEVAAMFDRERANEFALLSVTYYGESARLVRVSRRGRRIGAPVDVTPPGSGGFAVAYNPKRDEYLQVYRVGASLRGRRFSGTGRRLGRAFSVKPPTGPAIWLVALDYVPATGGYLVSWGRRQDPDEFEFRMRAQRLSRRGKPVGRPAKPLGRRVIAGASTTYDPRRGRFLVFATVPASGGYFRPMDATGAPAGPGQFGASKFAIRAVGYSLGRDAFVAVDFGMRRRLLAPGGRAFGRPRRLASRRYTQTIPNAVVSGRDEMLVGWSDIDDMLHMGTFYYPRVRRFDPAARRPLGKELQLRSPAGSRLAEADGLPSAVYSPDRASYLVAWPVRDGYPASERGVVAQVVPASRPARR